MTQGTRRFIWGLFLVIFPFYLIINLSITFNYITVIAIVIIGIYNIYKSFDEL